MGVKGIDDADDEQSPAESSGEDAEETAACPTSLICPTGPNELSLLSPNGTPAATPSTGKATKAEVQAHWAKRKARSADVWERMERKLSEGPVSVEQQQRELAAVIALVSAKS